MGKFKTGDICICCFTLKKKVAGNWISKKDCRVRIIKKIDNKLTTINPVNFITNYSYRVYNIDFNRYEEIGEIYLKKDIREERNKKIKYLLDE